jgi:hypothetical protein
MAQDKHEETLGTLKADKIKAMNEAQYLKIEVEQAASKHLK